VGEVLIDPVGDRRPVPIGLQISITRAGGLSFDPPTPPVVNGRSVNWLSDSAPYTINFDQNGSPFLDPAGNPLLMLAGAANGLTDPVVAQDVQAKVYEYTIVFEDGTRSPGPGIEISAQRGLAPARATRAGH
jgi:hypothetical protein